MSKWLAASNTGANLASWRASSLRIGVAFAVSIAAHALLVKVPAGMAPPPVALPPLTARLEQMPPPPAPAPPKPPVRRVRSKRAAMVSEIPTLGGIPAFSPPAPLIVPLEPEPPKTPAPEPAPPAMASPERVDRLPPRLDLVYTVFFDSPHVRVGENTYRFSHSGEQYRLQTIGEARGIAAIFYPGRYTMQSQGTITADGLQPQEFSVERGGPNKHEITHFDWAAQTVTLEDHQPPHPLDPPIYDFLSFLLQFYFVPPQDRLVKFRVASTHKLYDFEFERLDDDMVKTKLGDLATQHWKRKTLEGDVGAELWLAPDFYFIPVKIRLIGTSRGGAEQVLDSIFTDPQESDENPS